MNRDLVCISRLIIDSLPLKIRNSKILFDILRYFLKVPRYFYIFRKDYKEGKIFLYEMYTNAKFESRRISEDTDINSFHFKAIFDHIKEVNPKSILDLGCGSGFLLRKIKQAYPHIELTGVDLSCKKEKNIIFKQSSINEFFKFDSKTSYDLILSCHTLEHCENPSSIVDNIKAYAKKSFIIICPLEREFKWGLNYHINFFENKKSFLNNLNLVKEGANIKIAIGDIFYSKIN